MELHKIKTLDKSREESNILEFQLALETDNLRYRQKHVLPFSKAYL
jgi:hypothetical protein